jgi:hypothetical protein
MLRVVFNSVCGRARLKNMSRLATMRGSGFWPKSKKWESPTIPSSAEGWTCFW